MSLAPPGTPELGLYVHPYIPSIPEEFRIPLSTGDQLFIDEDAATYELTTVLNARQHQLFVEHGARRADTWKVGGTEKVAEEMEKEVKVRVESWKSLILLALTGELR
ncbi:hypothetical protein FOMPIDRAFT_94600 [Fomitopsis schrenkii]|uniref:Uncharacterized protein n=1 Tax=Fomitopsis schrenkii TaxID=2126942 RepID=S8G588_FOMSC|nr:hypothetical protein FOMPIDRAFT_94600 [Fomitopsis schrenkii]